MTPTLASMQFFAAHPDQFGPGPRHTVDIGHFPRHLFLLCGCTAGSALAATPILASITVSGAMLLALLCVGWLLFFIHHISQSISVNHIVDRIARETEQVIDQLMPHPRGSHYRPAPAPYMPDGPEFPILNEMSGYIRFIDTGQLMRLARMQPGSLARSATLCRPACRL